MIFNMFSLSMFGYDFNRIDEGYYSRCGKTCRDCLFDFYCFYRFIVSNIFFITGTIIVWDILNLRDYAHNDHSRGTVFSIKIPHCPGPSALVLRI